MRAAAYVMPGGIDPHTHMELLFMGTVSADDFDWGTKAASPAAPPASSISAFPPAAVADGGLSGLARAQKSAADYGFHVAVTWWSEQVARTWRSSSRHGVNTFKHFMAYKGAMMVDDETLTCFRRCAELGAMPSSMPRTASRVPDAEEVSRRWASPAPRARLFAAARGRRRGGQPGHRDRRHGRCRSTSFTSRASGGRGDRARTSRGKRVYGEPLVRHLVIDESDYRNPDWDHAA